MFWSKKKSADLLKRMALPSSAEGEPVPFRIAGISFDAEGTLVCYHTPDKTDDALLIDALHTFNQQTGVTPVPVPQWESDAERARCYNEQWSVVQKSLTQQFAEASPERNLTALYALKFYRPWMTAHEAVLFYRQVVQRTFATGGVTLDNHHFADFLIHEFYGGVHGLRYVYRPAIGQRIGTWESNLNELAIAAKEFPDCRWAVVSNTDSRIRDILLQIPLYKELFRGHIWTACDVDELKPSGWGVKAARQQACGPDAAANDGVWVHVGDQPSADGGAATASGSLFVQCDAGVGIDFSVIRWLLASTTLEEAQQICSATHSK